MQDIQQFIAGQAASGHIEAQNKSDNTQQAMDLNDTRNQDKGQQAAAAQPRSPLMYQPAQIWDLPLLADDEKQKYAEALRSLWTRAEENSEDSPDSLEVKQKIIVFSTMLSSKIHWRRAAVQQQQQHATVAPSPIATCGPTRISSACQCLATATATSATATSTPSNQIINGGFETGDSAPWALNFTGGWFGVRDNSGSSEFFPYRARTGTKLAFLSNPGEESPDSLSQPVSLTAGARYAFNAYYSVLDFPFGECNLRASIGGATVAETVIYTGAGGGNPPRYYKLEGIYRAPATTTTSLSLELWCDISSLGLFGLDDVSLVSLG
ncbi:hypothetical protein HJFPF1_07483 [Paramyrothecium foliicola]|nr:hypothetical protein HJFPF1_07483 [Paramyrothecium foliicola]